MFGSDVLEIAIGVIFVFLIASLLASALREMIEAVLKTRAVQLERGIRQLLDDPSGEAITKDLFSHPLLYGLFKGGYDPGSQLTAPWMTRLQSQLPLIGNAAVERLSSAERSLGWASSLPSYIPSRNFALALLHLVAGTENDAGALTLERVKANVAALPEGRVRQALAVAVGEAEQDFDRARASLEAWFDSNMDRVSGWYKRQTQWILLSLGLVLAVLLNIDSLNVAHELATNTSARQQVMARVDAAYATMKSAQPGQPLLTEQQLDQQAHGLAAVIGWDRLRRTADADWAAEKKELVAEAKADASLKTLHDKAQWVRHKLHSPGHFFWQRFWPGVPASLPGWLVTAIAVSLGAPFWFDLLNKFMVIRSTVKPYEKSSPEGSEDRSGGPSAAQQLAVPAGAPQQGQQAQQGQSDTSGAVQNAPATVSADLRIALAGAPPDGITLTKDGTPFPVPPDGFVELPLEVGSWHEVKAVATVGARKLEWTQRIFATLEHQGEPVEAELVPAGEA
jgi:hypothetical protein